MAALPDGWTVSSHVLNRDLPTPMWQLVLEHEDGRRRSFHFNAEDETWDAADGETAEQHAVRIRDAHAAYASDCLLNPPPE